MISIITIDAIVEPPTSLNLGEGLVFNDIPLFSICSTFKFIETELDSFIDDANLVVDHGLSDADCTSLRDDFLEMDVHRK